MAGKRLLDLAALFNATRGVAQKHVALRSRQVDVYNRTSTLARALRNQTDRVTETIKAASFLASRLNESAPSWTAEATEQTSERSNVGEEAIPSTESTKETPTPKPKGPLGEDHFYERSAENSAVDPPPKDDLDIQQEKPDRYPLPDGTIPPTESDLNWSKQDHDVISKRPWDEPAKWPLSEEGIQPRSSAASTIPIPARERHLSRDTRVLQRQSEFQIPSKTADALDDFAPDPLEAGHDEDSVYRKSTHISPSLSSLPRFKLPKHTSDSQGDRKTTGSINSDSFYQTTRSEGIPSAQAAPEQDDIPEGVDTALFYSPRVAKLLGGKTQGPGKSELEMDRAKYTPTDGTRIAADKDQDTFNLRSSSQKHPLDPSRFASTTSSSEDSNVSTQDVEGPAHKISEESSNIPEKVCVANSPRGA